MGAESVTAVVPHFGAPETPIPLLEALVSQAPGEGTSALQVVVVDDASPEPFPGLAGVEVVRRETNGGFGAAVNTGASVAEGDLLLVLNSDLEIGPTFVADLVAAARPWQPAVVSPRVVGPDGAELPTGRRFPRVRHQVTEWLVPLARWRDTDTLHRAVGHDVDARDTETVVDWVVGRRNAGAGRRLPRRGWLRRALLHELRGGRPPAPAPGARPAVRRALRADRRARRRRLERVRPPPRVAGAVAARVRRQVGWTTTAAGSPWVRPPPPTWPGTPAAASPVATSRRCAPLARRPPCSVEGPAR